MYMHLTNKHAHDMLYAPHTHTHKCIQHVYAYTGRQVYTHSLLLSISLSVFLPPARHIIHPGEIIDICL